MNRQRLVFTINYPVVPKQSMRVRSGRDGRPITYQAAKVKKNAAELASIVQEHRPKIPLSGPLAAGFVFCEPFRVTETKATKARGRCWRPTRPDYDNCAKQITDVLEASGFFANDGQLVCVTVAKLRNKGGSRVHVFLHEIGDDVGLSDAIERVCRWTRFDLRNL